ncbi:hypothetical protein [Cytobacillus firmus]|uniref:Uncharacterized protein n=2 Tax=Cytobacillus firmus TaxID=1399 RepID=A0AA46SLG7_CYTFI|nr:hypothetical protein [Cytobacillus firmus]KML39848.1 hypothetical protein VL14_15060 [Cytobacillus firmus]UYG97254.1 hypothetical protein OD459_09675 [Cytobacillus firmus]
MRLNAPHSILSVWKIFDRFPMETLTKAWYYDKAGTKKQRDVSLMKEHRAQYGIAGNCFDLAIWLLHEFKEAGIQAYPVGHDLKTPSAHAAVVAVDEEGRRFLCDLGDQWLLPILIDSKARDFTPEKISGFFPAADVQVSSESGQLEIIYHRPNGKISQQSYDTDPVELNSFLEAAERSQNSIYPKALLEQRLLYKNETAHWEFYNWKSFLSTTEGLYHDVPAESIEEWADRIHQKTGYNREFLIESLGFYKKLGD